MSIASQRKRKDHIGRAKIINNRTTLEKTTFKVKIKQTLVHKLYTKQFNFWNTKLNQLSLDNALSLGRSNDDYAIYWNNRRYSPVSAPFAPENVTAYCLPLNSRIKEYAVRMEEIAEELDALWDEYYESNRFITNLLTFEAPPARFEKILGATLFRVVQKPITAWFEGFDDNWNQNNEFSLRTFVEANQQIIDRMNERVMLNIVTV